MTGIQRIIMGRNIAFAKYNKTRLPSDASLEDAQEWHRTTPHGIDVSTVRNDKTTQDDLMRILDKKKGGWNNTRPLLKIVFADYEEWWYYQQLFNTIQTGFIKDCRVSKKYRAWVESKGTLHYN